MKKKAPKTLDEMYEFAPILPAFGTGQVAEVLQIPIWQLQNFLDGKKYQLTPEEDLGRGRGNHRRFTTEDVYRLAITSQLAKDGFSARFIGARLQELYDNDFWDRHADDGTDLPPFRVFAFVRTTAGPQLRLYVSLEEAQEKKPYYVLDISQLATVMNERLAKVAK